MPRSRVIRFALSPVLYALVLVPVLFTDIAFAAWIERHGGLHIIWRMGDIDSAVVGILLGGPVFSLATLALARLELLQAPLVRDHLRQSSILYVTAVVCGDWLVSTRARLGGGLGWGLVFTATAFALFAALVNAVTLKVLARRRSRASATQLPTVEST